MNPLLLVVALFVVNTLLMPLIVELVKERAPGLAMRLVKLSVWLLPIAHRDRYLEEWTAELEEMERRNISQLVASIRILLGAPSVGRVLRAKDRHRTLAERLASSGSYAAYMSYSRAADARLASALQQGLHRFAKPWYRVRAVRVFRDDTNLAANPGLWSAIEAAMANSAYFVLLASPEAARSQWIAREVEYWLQHKSSTNILIVLTDGEMVWDRERSDFDWSQTTALPATLRGVMQEEPRWLDLRWARSNDRLSLSDPRFHGDVADLAAPLHRQSKDELCGEDIRLHRRTRRILSLTTAVLATETILLVVVTAMLLRQ